MHSIQVTGVIRGARRASDSPAAHLLARAGLVIGHARGWWRWLFLIPAIAMPVLVALSRMYRGEHHPTDILASLLFSALWLTATSLLIKPNTDGDHAVVARDTSRENRFRLAAEGSAVRSRLQEDSR